MGIELVFPGLGLEFHLNRVAFTIGKLSITWYGIIMALGFLLGILYVLWRVKKFGLDTDRVIDVLLVAVVGGIVGARLYFVAFSWDEYKDNLIEIFKTWHGGIAIYGGLIGAVLVGLLMCKLRKVRILPMMDLAAGGVILGQAVGRWGNFVNIEAFGGITGKPWGMSSPRIYDYLMAHSDELSDIGMQIDLSQVSSWQDVMVHPTFFYESAWCLLGFIAIALYTSRRRFDGELLCLYGAWYGAGRFVIEGLRTDSLMWGSIRVSQAVALLSVVASLAVWIVARVRIRRANDPNYLKLYVNTEEAEQIRQGTFYQKPQKNAEPETAGKETLAAETEPATEERDVPDAGATGEPDVGQADRKPDGTDEDGEDADGKDH